MTVPAESRAAAGGPEQHVPAATRTPGKRTRTGRRPPLGRAAARSVRSIRGRHSSCFAVPRAISNAIKPTKAYKSRFTGRLSEAALAPPRARPLLDLGFIDRESPVHSSPGPRPAQVGLPFPNRPGPPPFAHGAHGRRTARKASENFPSRSIARVASATAASESPKLSSALARQA
jgi:hypothetical protein